MVLPAADAAVSLVPKLVVQLEFYFGDANLSKDRFLRQRLEESEHTAVPVDVVAAFNRMKQITTDCELVKNAVRQSDKLELVDNDTQIQRVDPLPEPYNVDDRTVYVERLPSNVDHDMLRDMFAPYGSVQYVSIPRFPDRKIKGFAFIEYAEPQEAEKAAVAEVAYQDGNVTHHIKIMHKNAWLALRREYMKLQRQLVAQSKKMAKALEKREAQKNSILYKKESTATAANNAKESGTSMRVAGTVVRLNNVNPDTRKGKIKDALAPFGEIAYVDFVVGRTVAHVRFASPDGSNKCATSLSTCDTVAIADEGHVLTATLLEGDTETEYWERMERHRAKNTKGSAASIIVEHGETVQEKRELVPHKCARQQQQSIPSATNTDQKDIAKPNRAHKRKEQKKASKKTKKHKRFDEGPAEGLDTPTNKIMNTDSNETIAHEDAAIETDTTSSTAISTTKGTKRKAFTSGNEDNAASNKSKRRRQSNRSTKKR